MGIKRNATVMREVKINFPLEKIRRIELIFKEEINHRYPELLKKVYDVDINGIPVKAGSAVNGEFILLLSLRPEETARFPENTVYMDTGILCEDGTVPETTVVEFDIDETLFGEVFKND